MKAVHWTLILAPAVLLAGAARIGQPQQDLVVHEWGTFTSVAGPSGEPVVWQPLTGPPDLPCFVNHVGLRNVKGFAALVRMETPVIYFYSPHPVTASVRVHFPQGKITEWYPQASRAEESLMEWNNVNVLPDTEASFPVDKPTSHYYAARETDAATLRIGNQQEKLIFYRGIGSFAVPLRPRFTADGRLSLKTGAREIPAAVLFENHGGRIAYRNLGALRGETTAEMPQPGGSIEALWHELEEILTAQGLYRKEARAMLETWRDSWFEQGTRVFYIMPRESVDAVLPLDITPQPSAVSRVFVGRLELNAPWMQQEIAQAIAADDTAVAAKYGRFLQPFLNGKSAGPRVRSYMDAAISRVIWGENVSNTCH